MAENKVELTLTARDQASSVIRGVMGSISEMVGQLTMLAGIGGAGAGLGMLVKQGIEFNKTMEDSKGGIAGVLLMTREYVSAAGRAVTGQQAMNAAFAEAATIQEQLKKDALATAASYTELVAAFQTALAPAAAAGVTNLDDVREITVMATQAMAALNIPTAQAAQELRGLFSGDMGPDNRLNQILRVSKDDLKALGGEAEKTAAFFKEKLGPAASAAAMQTGTLTVRLSNLGDILDQAMGKATAGAFKELSGGVADLTAWIEKAGASAATVGQAVWVSLKAAIGPLEELWRTVFSALDARVQESGGTWTEVIQGFAIVFNDAMTMIRKGWAVVFNAMASPLDALRLMFGNLLGNLLDMLATVAEKLPNFLGGDAIAKSLRSASAAVDEWGLKENSFLSDLEVALNRADEAHRRNEEAILAIGRATQKVTTDAKSSPKDLATDAAKAAEEMTRAFQKAAKEQARTWSAVVLTPLEKSLAFFKTGEAAVEDFIGVLRAKREQWQKAVADIFEFRPDDASAGAKAGMYGIFAALPSAAESAATAVQDVWRAMAQSFDDLFFNVLSGRLDNLEDVFRNLWDSVLRTFSGFLTDMLQRWIATQVKMEASQLKALPGATVYGPNGEVMQAGGGFGSMFGAGSVFAQKNWQGAAANAGLGLAAGSVLGQFGNGKYNAVGSQVGGALGGAVGTLAFSGAAAGPIGSIVGAIAGLIIGALLSPNTEKKLTGSIGAMVGATSWNRVPIYERERPTRPWQPGDEYPEPEPIGWRWEGTVQKPSNAFEREGQRVFESQTASLANIFRVGAKGQAGDLIAAYQTALKEALSGANFKIAAGSQEDIEKDAEYLLKNLLPRIGLSAAFGQYGYLPPGDRDLPGGIPGIDYGMPGMDESGKWIEKQLYDPEAPIPKMLAGIGFTEEKIAELASRISTDDPEKLLAYIEGIVGVVVGLRTLGAEMGKSFTELTKGWADEAAAGPAAAFGKAAEELAGQFDDLSLYSGDEQLQKAQEAQAAAEQFWESVKSYLQQLQALQEKLSAGLQSMREKMRAFLNPLSESGQMAADQGVIDSTWGKLKSAKTPADVERATNEAAAAIERMFAVLAERISRGKALLERLTTLDKNLGSLDSDLARQELEQTSPLEAWGKDLVDIQKQVADAAKLSGLEQIGAIEGAADSAEALYGKLKSLLSEIASTSAAINKSIDSQIWELGVGEMDPRGQATAVTDRIRQLQEQLQLATSPAEIAAITQEIQSLTNRYVGTFGKDDPNRAAAVKWAQEQLERTKGLANEALDAMREEAKRQAEELQGIIKTATTNVADNIDDAADAVEQLSHTLGELDREMGKAIERLGQSALDSLEPLRKAMNEASGIFTGATGAAATSLTKPDTGFNASVDRSAARLDLFTGALDRAIAKLNSVGGSGEGTTKGQTPNDTQAAKTDSGRRADARVIVPLVRRYYGELAPRTY